MPKTKTFLKRISLAICVVVLFAALGAVLLAPTASAQNAKPSTSIGEIYADSATGGSFVQSTLAELLRQLNGNNTGSGTVTVEDLKKNLTTTGTSVADKEIVVTFGGIQWNAVFLTTANTANGTGLNGNTPNSGDVILTLWQSYSEDKVAWNTYSVNSAATYPSNMYSTSQMRTQTLNNGGYYTTDGTNLTLAGQDTANKYAKFNMSRFATSGGALQRSNISNYLVAPRYLDWQKDQNAKMLKISGDGYGYLNNESWGFVKEEDYYGYNYYQVNSGTWNSELYYMNKAHYTEWMDDLVWLPSLTETGYNAHEGLWKTTQAQRQSQDISWLRSAGALVYWHARALTADGGVYDGVVASQYLVRPALHLNLSSAAEAAGGTTHEHNLEWKTDNSGNHYQQCTAPYCGYKTSPAPHNLTSGVVSAADKTTHTVICKDCGIAVTESHKLDSDLTKGTNHDVNGHWKTCSVCGKVDEVAHSWETESWHIENGKHWKECNDCGQKFGEAQHKLLTIDQVDATCSKAGVQAHYYCGGCDAYFSDSSGNTKIEGEIDSWKSSTGSIPQNSEHKFDSAWHYTDGTGHYHECEYNPSHHSEPITPHTLKWHDDGHGKHYQQCDDCGYTTAPANHTVNTATSTNGSETHTGQCSDCELTVSVAHDWSSTKTHDPSGHWFACQTAGCTEKKDFASHSVSEWNDASGGNHSGTCECGETLTEAHHWGAWSDVSGKHERQCDDCHTTDSGAHSLTHIAYVSEQQHGGVCEECNLYVLESHNAEGQFTDSDYHDDNSHWQVCQDCHEKVNEKVHNWEEGNWQQTSDYHYKDCNDCKQRHQEEHSATSWEKSDNIHKGQCVCGREVTEGHDLVWQVDDNEWYYQKCTKCSYETDHEPIGENHEHQWSDNYYHDDSNHWKQCETCGSRQEVSEHDASEWRYEDGRHFKYCSTCKQEYNEDDHSLVLIKRVDATCMTTGMREHWYCPVCKQHFTEEGADSYKLIANYGAWQTSTSGGLIPVDKTDGHNWDLKNLHHNQQGHWYECLNEGCTETHESSVQHDYNWLQTHTTWTFIDNDKHGVICEVCNEVVTDSAHRVNSWSTNGTETHSGMCEVCSEEVTQSHKVLDGFNHDNGNTHWHPCEATGCLERFEETEHRLDGIQWKNKADNSKHEGQCPDCRLNLEQDHVWNWVEVGEGTNEYQRVCEKCLYMDPETQGHVVKEWVPTEDGKQHVGQCVAEAHKGMECEPIYREHVFFTNFDGAEHWQECEECGYVDEETRQAHTIAVGKGTFNGSETHSGTCTECGQTVARQDHNWAYKNDDNSHWFECDVCGAKQDKVAHTVTWVTDDEHTHHGQCEVCGEELELEHRWLFGKCLDCGDELGSYATKDDEVGIAVVAIVAQLVGLIAVAAIISRRMKR